MNTFHATLRAALRNAGFLVLACGLPLTVAAQAQNTNNDQNSNTYNYNQKPPRYTGGSWTDHLVLEGGGGVTAPAAGTQKYANTGFNVLLGAGLRFNNRLSLLAEWNFNRMGVPHSLAQAQAQVPGGNEHIWATMLNPKIDYARSGRFDGYVIGGGGFSRQLTSFTAPVLVPCGYGYGYGFGYGYGGACSGSVNVAQESSNQGMFDVGTGAEFRFSPYSRFKLFLEARYEKFYTPKRSLPPGYDATLVPVMIGIRW
jgi:opacity protein-like surface antigen